MKKLKKWLVALLFLLLISNLAVAQSNLTLNVSNPFSYDYLFHNPAGMSFFEKSHGAVGVQLLHSGITNDKLRNNIACFAVPIGELHSIGVRAVYFTSEIFQRGDFSFLFAEKLFGGKFSFGFNANLVTLSYNEDKFLLAHSGDPLIELGTSKNVFSFGSGIMIRPSDRFTIGASFDHLNRPDISIDNSGFRKQMLSKIGATYFINPVAIQVDVQHDGFDLLYQGGLRGSFLDNSINIFGGYSAYGSQKNGFFVEVSYLSESIGLSYQYRYPLNEMSMISNGTHQISLLFQQKPSGFKIQSLNPAEKKSIVENKSLSFLAKISHPNGVSRAIFKNNGVIIKNKIYDGRPKVVDFNSNMELQLGKNELEIIAFSGNDSKSKKVWVTYAPKPKPPQISVLKPQRVETQSKQLKLEFIIDGVDSLSRIFIIINGDTLEYKGLKHKKRGSEEFKISQDIRLSKGMNDIELVASNQVGFTTKRLAITVTDRPAIGYREKWAVIIGINKYKNRRIPRLESAVSDAKKIAETLKKEFGFDHVITLYDEQATKDRILTVLEDSLRNVQPEDGVVIYFAGHGDTENTPEGDLGYIIPFNGVWKSYRANISMGQIRELSQKPKAKHILYILDSCFSGLLLTRGPADLKLAPKIPIQDLFAKTSRYVLTAGRKDEEGIDGILAKWLLQGIRGDADNNKDGFTSASELGIYVRQKVRLDAQRLHHQQTPQFGQITADDGEFVFIKKKK